MTTVRIYPDTIREARCRGRNCYRPLWWAQLVDTGHQIAFEVKPTATEVQGAMFGREIWSVEVTHDHREKCPNAKSARRER